MPKADGFAEQKRPKWPQRATPLPAADPAPPPPQVTAGTWDWAEQDSLESKQPGSPLPTHIHTQPTGFMAGVQMGKLRHAVCLVLHSQGMSSPASRGAGQSSAAAQGKVPSAHGPVTHRLHPGRPSVPGMQLPVPVPVRLHAPHPSPAARIRAQPLGSAGGGCLRSPEPTQGCRDGMQGCSSLTQLLPLWLLAAN